MAERVLGNAGRLAEGPAGREFPPDQVFQFIAVIIRKKKVSGRKR
jgi:hypothetical protein